MALYNADFHKVRTRHFPKAKDEDSIIINEGMYGKLIAEHLAQSLLKMGYSDSDVFPEDWGWMVLVSKDGLTFDVCVYNTSEGVELTDFSICVGPMKTKSWSLRPSKRIDYTPNFDKLDQDLLRLLKEDPKIDYIESSDVF